MKKTVLFIFGFLVLTSLVFCDSWTEDFDTGLAASYTTGTQTLDTGDWYTVAVYQELSGNSYGGTGHAARLNDDIAGTSLRTPALNTIGAVTFYYRELNSGGGTFSLEKSYNDADWIEITTQAFSGTSFTQFSYDINDDATTVYVRVVNDHQDGHLIIDEFSVTDYTAPTSDQTSFVMSGNSVPGSTIPSTKDTSIELTYFLQIGIGDDGTGDGLDTYVTNIRFTPYSTNTADWTDNIQDIVIVDYTTSITVIPGTINITDTFIDIPIASGELIVPDGEAIPFDLYVYLNSSNIEDNEIISFFIDADNHGFTADPSGSGFFNNFGVDIHSSDFTITVSATESQFTSVPTNVTTNTDFSVTCGAVDENGNVDVDYNSNDIEMYLESGNGTLSGTGVGVGVGQTLVNGVYSWTDVQYDTAEDFTLHTLIQNTLWNTISGTITASDAPTWVINEILADPPPITGDANGDGTVDTSEDEFVELINNGLTSVDIGGWTISDAVGVRHIFDANTIIAPNNAVVVFGGGTPTGTFGGATVVTASGGYLGFNNGGDTVTLDNGSDSEVITYTYGAEGGNDQSITRDPDITGDFVLHSLATGSGGALFSPGTTIDDNPLPVNLSAFYALYIGGSPTLYWVTQTETENAYWNVYRGTNDNFTQAGHLNAGNPVPGNGTTNSASEYVYVDDVPVIQNTTYWYWIEDVSFDGETVVHEPITLTIPFEDTPITPDTYGLHQNYPNPFNPSTSISFALSEESDVELIIYNIKGAKIRTIFNDHIYADQVQSVIWDGNDATGKQVSSGVYFYKLITETKEYQKKMLLVK